jgi:hypothetical protein
MITSAAAIAANATQVTRSKPVGADAGSRHRHATLQPIPGSVRPVVRLQAGPKSLSARGCPWNLP